MLNLELDVFEINLNKGNNKLNPVLEAIVEGIKAAGAGFLLFLGMGLVLAVVSCPIWIFALTHQGDVIDTRSGIWLGVCIVSSLFVFIVTLIAVFELVEK